ncbi:DUF4159 domain-containing protein [Paracoccus sanguinis]|uniref:DUF4159 domain-containing protein n=2 Tax=Paracoccus sanguinis TaxID=1545044 RepID=A0A1H2ZG62_9RHOB|nr:DUF4159 domain-containing protein [Paracoccus sanguinis]SDX16345.1 protein of unknown function [Paracoccus sanguinis]
MSYAVLKALLLIHRTPSAASAPFQHPAAHRTPRASLTPRLRPTALLLPLLALLAAPALAQDAPPPAPGPSAALTPADPDPRLAEAAGTGALAYVVTGDPRVDTASEAGLTGLSQALTERTTVEPGPPVGVDLDTDDLSLLTFLYWPVTEDQPLPGPPAYAALNRFLRTGGMIVFDTRDGDLAGTGAPDASAALQRLAAPLDIPPLAPLPPDHVLTRAFYLLDSFPGRWTAAPLWVEAPQSPEATGAGFAPSNDGVSPVIIGGNAYAEAWATTPEGLPAYAIGAGYDGERQRELALRFGINLVMYALSGNYKSDQVHVPELLERLGREAPRGSGVIGPEAIR